MGLLSLFGGGSLKWILAGLAALVIVTAIGGYFLYQKSLVSGLQETITKQQEQIAGLQLDNEKLVASNQSLQQEIDRRVNEAKEVREELTRLREVDAVSRNRLADVERQLRDYERQKRIDKIRESKKASLLLLLINKSVKCYIENFDRFDGKCISGKFVLDGERFDGKDTVPLPEAPSIPAAPTEEPANE